jgi:hypothetical protein
MRIISIIFGYIKWHYSTAFISFTTVWKNILYFIFDFFSIRLVFKNFFDPWKRMSDPYPKSFSLKKYFYAFLTNIIVRIVGMIMRTAIIIVGLACSFTFILFYPLALIIWILMPFITLSLLGMGLLLIFK